MILDNLILRYIQSLLNKLGVPSFQGMTLIILIFFIVIVGLFGGNVLGRGLVIITNLIINRLPFIRTIYSAIQQIFEAVLKDGHSAFSKVALIQYPRKGLYSLAFITGDAKPPIDTEIADNAWTVFLPTTPNPTSGFLLFIPKKDTIILDIPIDVAAKIIMSAGVLNTEQTKRDSPLRNPATIKSIQIKTTKKRQK